MPYEQSVHKYRKRRTSERCLTYLCAYGHTVPVRTDDLLTSADIAEQYGFHQASVNRWARKGYLVTAARTPGPKGRRRFRRSDVEALLDTTTDDDQVAS